MIAFPDMAFGSPFSILKQIVSSRVRKPKTKVATDEQGMPGESTVSITSVLLTGPRGAGKSTVVANMLTKHFKVRVAPLFADLALGSAFSKSWYV